MPKIAYKENKELNYQWINKELNTNTVIIFLHEALGSIGQWKTFPKDFCDDLKLTGLVYERQGYGLSSPLDKKRDKNYLEDYALIELPQLMNLLIEKDKEVILVGHSDGASISLIYAGQYPQKVKAVISMAAHVINEEITREGIGPAMKAFEMGKLNGLKKYHGSKTKELFYAWADTWNSDFFIDWNICPKIQELSCPTLIIQGVNDQYGSDEQVNLIYDTIQSEIKEIILVEDCGHHPHLEQAERIIEESIAFIQKKVLD